MYVTLVVRSGKKAGSRLRVNKRSLLIGRAEDCHLRPHSDVVSRHHCALLVEDGYVGVKDFGSKNGTYVNGQRIEGERALNHGDVVRVGNLEFEVQFPQVPAPAAVADAAKEQPPAERGDAASDSEIDLASLFGTPREMSSTETKTIGITGPATGSLPADPAPERAADETVASDATSETEPGEAIRNGQKSEADGVAVVGVARGRYKPKTATPRDAAAEALRKFFGYK